LGEVLIKGVAGATPMARWYVGQIIQDLIEPVKISRAQRLKHFPGISFNPRSKRHYMGFYDIHAGQAILAAFREVIFIQFVLMVVTNIVHNIMALISSLLFLAP
jgi:hypothetical protein